MSMAAAHCQLEEELAAVAVKKKAIPVTGRGDL
jgi:hypothetical protein